MHIKLEDINTEGISSIEPIDITYAREFGCRIKLLAISKNHGEHVEARIHPTMVPEKHMLASINGAYNGVYITGDTVGNVLLYGMGAGKMPTGSAVVSDIVDIGRNIINNSVNRTPCLAYLPEQLGSGKITPMKDLTGPFYFRFSCVDKPGVLSKISGILGKYDISIESVIQKDRQKSGTVPVIMQTHEAREDSVVKAITEIDNLDICLKKTVKIRILS
jgi:homoserine dehydrogenase